MTKYNEFCNEEAQVTEEQPKDGFLKKHWKEVVAVDTIMAVSVIAAAAFGYHRGKKWYIHGKPVLKTNYTPQKVHILFWSGDKYVNGMGFDTNTAREISKELLELAEKAEQATE